MQSEVMLYRPVKCFLEQRGYSVKGEIGSCDVVGLKGEDPPLLVVCELKLGLSLELVLQAVDRASAADEIWIASSASNRGKGREHDRRFRDLCRRLGFGLLTVTGAGQVDIVVPPGAALPRGNRRHRSRLIDEHRRRKGDPTPGGSTRAPVMTAYRQQAIACAQALVVEAKRPRDLRPTAPDAQAILYRNVYGWFERVDRGLYGLSPAGRHALERECGNSNFGASAVE